MEGSSNRERGICGGSSEDWMWVSGKGMTIDDGEGRQVWEDLLCSVVDGSFRHLSCIRRRTVRGF